MGLIDVGFSGHFFTWNHGHMVETQQSVRLDRVLCDGDWRTFLEALVLHFSRSHSDHCPIILEMSPFISSRIGRGPFRFFVAWMEHPDFQRLMDESWSSTKPVPTSLHFLKDALIHWNKKNLWQHLQQKEKA